MKEATVTIRLSRVLAQMTGGNRLFEACGSTVEEVLRDFVDRERGMSRHVFDESGAVRRYILLVHQDEYVRGYKALERPVAANDEIFIVTSVTGG